MHTVHHLSRRLVERPVTQGIDAEGLEGITLRTYGGPDDIERWLEIRHRAFAREKLGVRRWSRDDFDAEFLAKPWWSPERMWFAETSDAGILPLKGLGLTVGTVTLAERRTETETRPVVHWLAVLPGWRRRGVAHLLMSTLEARAWDDGYREVHLETHAAWKSAMRFYESLGYRAT